MESEEQLRVAKVPSDSASNHITSINAQGNNLELKPRTASSEQQHESPRNQANLSFQFHQPNNTHDAEEQKVAAASPSFVEDGPKRVNQLQVEQLQETRIVDEGRSEPVRQSPTVITVQAMQVEHHESSQQFSSTDHLQQQHTTNENCKYKFHSGQNELLIILL